MERFVRRSILLPETSSPVCSVFFFFNDTATTEIYTLSLHDALPISRGLERVARAPRRRGRGAPALDPQVEEELGVLHRSPEVPIVSELVRRRRSLGPALLLRSPPPTRRLADHLRARAERRHRDSDAGEAQRARLLERPPLRARVRDHA